MVLLIICTILFIIYSWLVLFYWRSWTSIPVTSFQQNNSIKVSVIIPARNEAENIGQLLKAIAEQTYPKELTEVIVVDDDSSDNTTGIVNAFPMVKLISLKEDQLNSYKKKAIEKGIAACSGDLIIATDADCIPGTRWINTLAGAFTANKTVFIAAPVAIDCNNSILQSFQAMDFMMLQSITGAVVYKKQLSMCNGANIAYSKKAFDEVNGFSGIDSIASGDDMLLMYKIWKRHPDGIVYLKDREAIVSTQPQKTWKAFFDQRIRWASKAAKYEDKRFLPVLLLVWLFNFSFIVLAVAGFFSTIYWFALLGLWVGKTLVELPLFRSAVIFFNKEWALRLFFFFQPLHIAYTVISGLFGQSGTYQWKGRKVR